MKSLLLALPLLLSCSAALPEAKTHAERIHECAVEVLRPEFGAISKDILAALLAGGRPDVVMGVHGVARERGMELLLQVQECTDGVKAPLPAGVKA